MARGMLRIAVAACGVLAGTTGSLAQQPLSQEVRACEGEISSLSLGVVPDADAYSVDIFDPTEQALKFRDVFLTTLRSNEKTTREDGNLVFTFRAESIFRGVTSRTQVNPTYRADPGSAKSSRRTDEDETRELIQSDRPTRRSPQTASQQVVVEAELRNNETQRVIWLASVRCDPLTGDERLLMKFIAEVLVDNIGLAVKQKEI